MGAIKLHGRSVKKAEGKPRDCNFYQEIRKKGREATARQAKEGNYPILCVWVAIMKTTLERPDELFRQAKVSAASSGQSLKTFFTEALQAKLTAHMESGTKPWMRHFGSLKHLGSERANIEARIAEAFESIPT